MYVRMRTAVGTAVAFIALKCLLTYVALLAWSSTPGRDWVRTYAAGWHLQLGTVGEWLAAWFTAAAVGVALWVAGHENRTRRRERSEADLAQARLVREEFDRYLYAQNYGLQIHNYGAQAILDVYVEEVYWALEPTARWKPNDEFLEIVKPDHASLAGGTIHVAFIDEDGNPFPEQIGEDGEGNPQFATTKGGPEVVYTFMDANGNRWRTGTFIETPELVSE